MSNTDNTGENARGNWDVGGNLYPLPQSWTKSSIGEVTVSAKQRDPRKNPDDEFHYVDVSSVSNQSFKITGTTVTIGSEAPSRARKEIKTDDVLFATVRPTLKRIALVPKTLDGQIASTGYCVLRSDQSKVDFYFLYLFLTTDYFNSRMAGLERGANYPAVRDCDVKNSWLPLPPLPEQKKIAHILSTAQQAIEAQERIIQTTTELFKSMLHKLMTAQIRVSNSVQRGVEGDSGEGRGMKIEEFQFPSNWKLSTVAGAFDFTGKPRGLDLSKNGDKIPFFPMDRILVGRIYVSEFTPKPLANLGSGTYVENGDLVVAKITPSFENGKQAIVDIETDFAYATTEVIPIRGRKGESDTLFLLFYLLHPEVRSALAGKMEGSTGRQRLSKTVLGDCLIPLPPLSEQKKIAHILSAAQNKIDKAQTKKSKLKDLFRTLLHELMTAKIRV